MRWKVLKMDSDNGGTTLWIHLMDWIELYSIVHNWINTLKMVKMVTLYFTIIFKKFKSLFLKFLFLIHGT